MNHPIPFTLLGQVGAPGMAESGPTWVMLVTLIGCMIVLPGACLFIWFWWRRRSGEGAAPAKETTCGACGYPVRGLSTFICPECGSDLRDVGMVAARPRSGAVTTWNCLMWCLLWLFAFAAYGAAGMSLGTPGPMGPYLVPGFAVMVIACLAGILFMVRPGQGTARRSAPPPLPTAPELHVSTQPSTTVTRNLTIMFIDVEDFTGLAAASSRDGLIGVIRRARELVKPQIARHHGRLIKTMGDGFLVTFDSPTEAVLAGRDVQTEAKRRAAGRNGEDESAMRFRIGVTTGEVALEDDDIFGDPVNLAARIQQLAPPGEVYFSEATFHAMTKSEISCERAGEFEVKGVAGRVTVYRAT